MNHSRPLPTLRQLGAALAAVLAALAVWALFTTVPSASAAPGEVVRGTAVADIALYAQQDAASEQVGGIAAATTLQALDLGDGWFAASFDGETRYFSLNDANFARYTATDSSVMHGAVVGGELAVLAVPAAGGAVSATFSNGATIQFCRFDDSYYMARLSDGSICYIDASRVRLYAPVESGTLVRWAGEGGARVFVAPDLSSSVLATFEAGRQLAFADFDAEWLMASMTVEGVQRTVFVPKTDVVAEEPVAPEPEPEPAPSGTEWIIASVPASGMAEASWDSAKLESFRKGAVLTGLPTGNGWYLVVYDGVSMYLSSDQVKVIPSTSYSIAERAYGVSLAEAVSLQNDGSWIVGNSASNRAGAEDLLAYMDPANFPAGTSGFFQFLVLTQPLGVSVGTLDAQLAGKGSLEGQGQAFHDACYAYGINEAYLVAQALHETGNGQSTLAQGVWYVPAQEQGGATAEGSGRAYTDLGQVPASLKGSAVRVYNVYGIGAVDSDPLNGGARYAYEHGWTTVYDAIYGGARFIGRTYFASDAELGYGYASTLSGQNTLYKMLYHPEWVETYREKPWHEYATDVAWANAQTYYITQMLADYDYYTLTFEVPNYVG